MDPGITTTTTLAIPSHKKTSHDEKQKIKQPLLTAKNFIQDGRSLPLTNPAVWYRGWAAGVLMCVPMTVVQFGASRFLEQAFENRGDASGAATMSSSGDPPPAASASVPFTTKLTSAWCAGALSAVFVQPLCLCQIQQQKFGGSLVDTGRRLINSHGVRVLAHAGYLYVLYFPNPTTVFPYNTDTFFYLSQPLFARPCRSTRANRPGTF